jgi:hypothetical protein
MLDSQVSAVVPADISVDAACGGRAARPGYRSTDALRFDTLQIRSPKQNGRSRSGWEAFFPYYAGYSEDFAFTLLSSANLPRDTVVFDPWNGSGTTSYTSSCLGLNSLGFDLNPAMIFVARARLLLPREADSIEPLAIEIIRSAERFREPVESSEPLYQWFSDRTVLALRAIEKSTRHRLLDTMMVTSGGTKVYEISGITAAMYVSLFAVCRELVSPFLSSNPTWLRRPKAGESKVDVPNEVIEGKLITNLRNMAHALTNRYDLSFHERGVSEIRLSDATTEALPSGSADLILASPPYCTRIDYTAATRIELAVLDPLVRHDVEELSRRMIGTTRVPQNEIKLSPTWGEKCQNFLETLRRHQSKASSGYYYKTHLDYFDKMSRSIFNLAQALRPQGGAILVVQDSYYKELYNDLPSIITEMGEGCGLEKRRHENFRLNRSMSGINPYTRLYKRKPGAVEAVLCFTKH